MQKSKSIAALAAVFAGLAASAATNGVWTIDNGTHKWTSTGGWRLGTVPNGGVATFWSCPSQMNIDVDSVALEGLIRTGPRVMSFTNTVNGIQFVGDPSFIINWASELTMKGPLTGTGTNRLEFGGQAGTCFEHLASNFGEVAVVDSYVSLPAKSGTILSSGNVAVGDGEIRVAPALGAGETASLAMCDGVGSRFTCGPGLGRLSLNHGAGDGVTLTLPSIVCSNGALCVNSATALTALGEADKLLVTDPPAVVNGMITPAIAVYDHTSTKTGYSRGSFFATYDHAKGVVPAVDPVAWDAADQSAAIVRLAADATVGAAKSVYALYWDAAANRTLTLNDDLRILSGGLIVNVAADDSVPGMRIVGEGALDFGDRQGIVRGSSIGSSGTRTVSVAVNAPIKGTKGVVFSGTPTWLNGGAGSFYDVALNRAAAWTGPTVIANGVKVTIADSVGAGAFPAGGDVYLIGGDHRNGASIRMTKSATFDQNFVISGGGVGGHGSGNTGPFHLGGGDVVLTFNGTTRFQDAVYFAHDNSSYVMKFVGKVSGGGRIDMRHGVLEFAGENDYRGEIVASASGGAIVVSGDGSLGRARVGITGGDLKFDHLNGQTIANDIASTGTLTIDGGHVVLTGRVKSAKTVIRNGAVVEIGDDVDLGKVTLANGSKVLAAPGATRARLDIGGDGVTDYSLSNGLSGESDVALVKTGTNTVVLCGSCAFGGEMTIAEGTVKLAPGLLATATMWLDASQSNTITYADGQATVWRSANGNGRVFTCATDSGGVPGTYPASTPMNGLNAMHFDHTGTTYTWFVCDDFIDIRSIYLCMRPYFYDPGTPTTITPWGWYGKGNPESALRWATYQTWHGLSFTEAKMRVNGGRTPVPAQPDGVPMIVGQFNADDSENAKTMKPSIGGHQTWSRTGSCYNGDIAEVIAFDHELTESEQRIIEQYLSAKWGVYDIAGLWPEADISSIDGGAVLADTAAVTLVSGAVLDLNGADQTIASLAGVGMITNSAATRAVLKVTGACDFNGVVAANVRLVASGTVKGVVDGELVADGANVTLADCRPAPPSAGRLWWFDAAEVTEISGDAASAGSIRTNGHGRVTRWYAKGDAETYFESGNNGGGAANYAEYVEAAAGVTAGLYMNAQVRMTCNQANTPHTIAVMYVFDASYSGSSYFFCGDDFGDSSMRAYSNKDLDFDFNFRQAASFSNYGDHIYVNGTRIEIDGTTTIRLPQGTLCCYIGTRDPSHTDANWVNRKFCFGSSCWSKGVFGTKVCEAICYDRLLTDDECRALNAYLTDKWSGSGIGTRKAAVGPHAVVGAKGGATLDLSAAAPATVAKLVADADGGTIVGDVVAGGFDYDAENKATALPLVVDGALTIAPNSAFTVRNSGALRKATHTLLSADSATGAFASWDEGETPLQYRAGAAKWSLTPCGFLFLLR